jgi:hypothetical protein
MIEGNEQEGPGHFGSNQVVAATGIAVGLAGIADFIKFRA